ncbi:MAG TPA: LysR family transcriptional regulator [Rubrivivax sp.]|nr:LysR family transcriptional regulator [Rubrivivax sp.]
MKIKLHLLRQAQALKVHGSFSRAAAALNLSQPALSQGIKELEEQVGLQLFVRSRSGLELTDFGRVFMRHAEELVSGAADLEREVGLAKGLATGELSAGAGPYVMERLAPICVPAFAAAHPGVRLRILMDSPSVLARFVRTRALDLGVAEASVLENDDDLEVVAKLAPIPGYVVVRAGHPLTTRVPINLANALEYPFAQVVMLPPRVLKPILASRSLAAPRSGVPPVPFPAIECPTLRLATDIVASSDAFALAPLGMVRAELEQRRVVPLLHEPWMHSEWAIVRLRKRTMSPAMTAFVEELERAHREVLREEERLRERWYRPGNAHREPAKHGRAHAESKPTRAIGGASVAGKRR